ncbi:hypothetical protein KY338_05465 [Candidatus Woesearchaeota archaeon]|nr:hypothetical protein [Candidatus Woesearchaeota archaeon]MBW3006351.1 hypothetical protein [Candidatus Woesearchaeota archaeon]
MAEIVILPALLLGLIIGIYEAILLHRDVSVPTHRFGHMAHALVYAIIAVFFTMNAAFIYSTFSFLQGIPLIQYPIVFQIAVGVITMIKVHGASAAIRGSVGGVSVGMKETWAHSAIIAVLVVAAPYVWPFVAPVLPSWLK